MKHHNIYLATSENVRHDTACVLDGGAMATFRKMTMGEIAEIAGDPKETIRSRINRGVSDYRKAAGWARFDVPDTLNIAVHAEMMRRVGVEQVAVKAANYVGEAINDYLEVPPFKVKRKGQIAENYLIFRRITDDDFWTMHAFFDQKKTCHAVGQYMADTSMLEGAAFLTVNAGTLADWALDRIFDLQGIEGDEAEAEQCRSERTEDT